METVLQQPLPYLALSTKNVCHTPREMVSGEVKVVVSGNSWLSNILPVPRVSNKTALLQASEGVLVQHPHHLLGDTVKTVNITPHYKQTVESHAVYQGSGGGIDADWQEHSLPWPCAGHAGCQGL